MAADSSDDFSVLVLASDLGVDGRPFLSYGEEEEQENWHDCSDQYLSPDEDFSDLNLLQFFHLQGSDKQGNRIFRVVGKYFPGKQSELFTSFCVFVIWVLFNMWIFLVIVIVFGGFKQFELVWYLGFCFCTRSWILDFVSAKNGYIS